MRKNKDWKTFQVSDTGDARAEPYGWANSGYVGSVTVEVKEAFRPQWPLLVGSLPAAASWFEPRECSPTLHDWMASTDASPSTMVLYGMGGTGKTQVAADLATAVFATARSRTADSASDSDTRQDSPAASPMLSTDLVVWVTADSTEHIVGSYARAWRAVTGLRPSGDVDDEAARFLSWLTTTPRGWLMVLDDVPDLGALRDWWPPNTAGGRCVVTTRSSDASWRTEHRARINVGLYSPAMSRRYLQRVLEQQGRERDADELDRLAVDLGHLPLALAQAAAYLCEDRSLTIAQYRALLADRILLLADVLPDVSSLPDAQQHIVAAAWHVSLQRADELTPVGLARPLLLMLCLLDPHGVPMATVTSPASVQYLTARLSGRHRPVSAHHVRQALRVLRRLSLVYPGLPGADDRGDLVGMHQLIQRAVREASEPAELATAVRAAADSLQAAWPPGVDYADTVVGRSLASCAEHLVAQDTANALWNGRGPHSVLSLLGLQLQATGRREQGLRHYTSMLHTARRLLGHNHPETLFLRSDIAGLRAEDGDVAGAVAELQEVLALQCRHLGEESAHALTTLNNLAHWRGGMGDYAGAVTEYDRLIVTLQRLGTSLDEADVLMTRRSRAYYMTQCGREAEALPELHSVVQGTARVNGPRHPRTMVACNALASCLGRMGRNEEAAEILTSLLTDQRMVHGELHGEVLITRSNLAQQRARTGHIEDAVVELTQLVPLFMEVFGPHQVRTLTCRSVLAEWTWRAGRKESARAQMAEVVDDAARALGSDHHVTSEAHLSLTRWSTGT
ncbi:MULTISPECIES: tetratricopeptide repeat protein [unclassified Streptomyces]|uniref:tetratricopeptide repeat protein n=2 Tax=Streptomyces TaxID=1883 RepID=UPI002DDA6AD0|nr:tetratricopeptide repeat protein [Streptomyces sp. NBC_01763]WSC34097.1 tetratricopeptide repeat protein [Streptomyces sp. NBC_01763]WSC41961.1 tetratricopeptide repeat protein [Streptomyces sp. NBC_01763]WSF81728.1 tetratricopeptide repeat protein [Streptomyces sp. NBC_01744]WSF89737.1 tetratricopeptide repeat protein [Streptomyces sp. NBC_01744]